MRACVAGLSALAAAAVLGMGAGEAHALQPLGDFVQSAHAKAVENKEAKSAVTQREAEADQAWGRVLPAFTARASYTRNENAAEICQKPAPLTCTDSEKVVITPHDQLDATFSLEIPLIDVAGWNRVGAARANVLAAGARAQATALDVDRALAQRYFQTIAAHALVDAAKQAVAAAEASQKVAVARESAGTTSTLEIDRAAAEVARTTQSVADAELLRSVSRRALESMSGLAPSDGAPALAEDLSDEGPVDAWEKEAAGTPSVRAAQHEKEAADRTATATWASLLPTVSATATERVTNATGFAGQTSSYTIGLTASIRLDFAGIRAGSAQEAAATTSALRKERAERDARDKIFEAHQQVVAQIAKSKAARAQVKAARHAAEVARDRYALGAGTQLDVLQADRDAFQAEVSRIQADADLGFARVALRLAAGRSIDSVKAAAGGSSSSATTGAGTTASTTTGAGSTASTTAGAGAAASTTLGAGTTASAQGARR
ncbi:MAG: TolC family protein [Polyangiaceae bacterium]